MAHAVKAVIFDFGGVLAEEGFRDGLLAIGRKNGTDPERFRKKADDLIHESGYVTGAAEEAAYWDALRKLTGINGSDAELRREILSRFILRQVLAVAEGLRGRGYIIAVQSDQTNWLEELDGTSPFLQRFDRVFAGEFLRAALSRITAVFRRSPGASEIRKCEFTRVRGSCCWQRRSRCPERPWGRPPASIPTSARSQRSTCVLRERATAPTATRTIP